VRLSDLDQRFVAAAAPKVAKAVGAVTAAGRLGRDAVTGLARSFDVRDLRALDDRYATKGPLALFREVPQLLAVVVGIVFMVGTLAAAHELKDHRAVDQQTVEQPDGTDPSSAPASRVLGPTVGKPASAYLSLAAKSLDAAAAKAPDDQRLALVSLSSYYRPEQAARIVSGYVVNRAWVRARGAGKTAPPLPIEVSGDVAAALHGFYARTAKGQTEAAQQYQELADTTTNDPQYKAFYEQFVRLSRTQARAFGSNCDCVFSFLVTATPTQLMTLRSRPGVRAVEVAGRGAALTELDISTLLPEVKGVVPNPAAVVDPPS
jgi:hypothetical protein